MKQLTENRVKTIQEFLRNQGIFYGVPSGTWSHQAIKALFECFRREGIRHPMNVTMPNTTDDLPEVIRKAIATAEATDLIEVTGNEEVTVDTPEEVKVEIVEVEQDVEIVFDKAPEYPSESSVEEVPVKEAEEEILEEELSEEEATESPQGELNPVTTITLKKKHRK